MKKRNFVVVSGLTLGALVGAQAQAELVYAVTDNGALISFDSATPNDILSGVAISGLAANELTRAIDFRPATGELYALGSFSNLYRLNTATGQATLVGALSVTLNGASFGFDFNPQIDRIRVVSDTDQNLVVNPNDASTTNATALFYGPGDVNNGAEPNVVGSAYNNNFAGTSSTQLYGIDSGLDILVRQANSAGTLETVGPLGVDVTALVGFDISGVTGTAYTAVQNEQLGLTTFWTVNLGTGAATSVGEIGGGSRVRAIAVVPTPGALGLLGLAGLATARRRTR